MGNEIVLKGVTYELFSVEREPKVDAIASLKLKNGQKRMGLRLINLTPIPPTLVNTACMSRRNFQRKWKNIFGDNP
jgi:hypothetical protein